MTGGADVQLGANFTTGIPRAIFSNTGFALEKSGWSLRIAWCGGLAQENF